MNRLWKTGLVGAVALTLAVAGCVEEDASVVMLGSLIGSGDIEVDEEEEDVTVGCDFPLEFDEPNVYTRGFVNLTELGLVGQPLVDGSYERASQDRYTFQAVFENRLFDSRTVGAVSGGDGGGFENLDLDKNDIMIESATVEFPTDENTYADDDNEVEFFPDADVSFDRPSSMLVQSGGGVARMGIPLINNSFERELLEDFLEDLREVGLDVHTFIARIQLHGETLGGTEVESNTIDYPIDMCTSDLDGEDLEDIEGFRQALQSDCGLTLPQCEAD